MACVTRHPASRYLVEEGSGMGVLEERGGGWGRGGNRQGRLWLLLEEDHVTRRFDLIKFLIWKRGRGNVSDSIRVAVASDRM